MKIRWITGFELPIAGVSSHPNVKGAFKRNTGQILNQEQYSRRECIEFIGIPDSIPNNEIENKVGDILSKLDISITGTDIQACHRLKDKDRVIVKFSNRKTTMEVLRNRKKLKTVEMSSLDFPEETKIFANESLCPYYRGIWAKCRKLLNDGLIKHLWTYNGTVTIRKRENDDRIAISHDDDLVCLFPNYEFKFLKH